MSEYAVALFGRNLPNAEETEHVVEAIGVEVVCHVAEACLPPGISVACHFVPVVGGKAPVLSVSGEEVGRCTGVAVKMKQPAVNPGPDATGRDAYGYVALEHYTKTLGTRVNALHLAVE